MQENAIERSKSKRSAIVKGSLAALTLGSAGFFTIYSDLLGSTTPTVGSSTRNDNSSQSEGTASFAFVELDPILVTINRSDPPLQLRFEAQLEVSPESENFVRELKPRIMDTMNSYIRAIEINDLRDPSALLRLRSQLLRRIQVVVGQDIVKDLLVSKFIIS